MTNKKTTRFTVTIYGDSGANNDFLKCIALHNEGKTNLTLEDFEGYAKVNKNLYPLSWREVTVHKTGDSIEVWEGEDCKLLIEETIHYELNDEVDALTQANGFGALADG